MDEDSWMKKTDTGAPTHAPVADGDGTVSDGTTAVVVLLLLGYNYRCCVLNAADDVVAADRQLTDSPGYFRTIIIHRWMGQQHDE